MMAQAARGRWLCLRSDLVLKDGKRGPKTLCVYHGTPGSTGGISRVIWSSRYPCCQELQSVPFTEHRLGHQLRERSMKCISLLRHFVRLLTSVLALLVIVSEAYAVDTYNPLSKQLTIPSAAIGSTTYTDMVITVGSIVSCPTGTTPLGSGDTYDQGGNQLTVPSVLVGTT